MTTPGHEEEAIPAALRDRLSSALAAVPAVAAAGPARPPAFGAAADAAACLAAGEALLAGVLSGDCASRDTALDLLAADALVTRAFERAADEPASLPALADAAMRRIALLAG